MLLNNNGPMASEAAVQQASGSNGVFRQQRRNHNNNNNNNRTNNSKKGQQGGASSVRNSWSFVTELPIVPPVKENLYADPEALLNANAELKSVSRSRLRQRSVSNLNAAALAGTRAARDHSASSRHQNGTISAKGVDYIRIHALPASLQQPQQTAVQTATTSPVLTQIQDRSEYGNPDGSSAHSTAEREAGVVSSAKNADLYQVYEVINQNQSNDYKVNNQLIQQQQPEQDLTQPPFIRMGSGRSSAAAAAVAAASAKGTRGSPREVRARKPNAAAAPSATTATATSGPNAVKTEWTFLPSPTAPTEPLHREINFKSEESSMVRKGLLWVMRDRIFSRYHERFCILTRNYLHCFKKGTEASLTQMGNFLFKVSLADVVAVQWLDKRGTAIVCLTLAKEGRLLVKTSMDLNGWFDDLQNCVKETIGRRQTLLSDQRRVDTFTPTANPVAMRSRQHQHQAGQQQQQERPAVRDRSLASRNRSANRFSLMSDHEVRLTTATAGAAPESTDNSNSSGLLVEPLSLCYNVPAQMTSSPGPTAVAAPPPAPPVPVPYRERSVSFDRSRVSKAEREAKRRSYYPSNHVTQV